MSKFKLSVILRIIFSFSLLGLLLWLARKNFARIWQLLSSANISMFILAFLLFFTALVVMSWRLKIALGAQNISFPINNLFSLTLIGYFFTNFMPTAVGGDLVKGYYLSRKINSKMSSYTSVFIDRITGMFSLIWIASVALLITRKDIEIKFIFWIVGLLFIFSIISILLLFNRRLLRAVVSRFRISRLLQIFKFDELAKKIYDSVHAYRSHKKKLMLMLALSIFGQFFSFFAVYLLANSLSVHLPFVKILLFMPLVVVLCMLPVTINGLGLREWAFVLFFQSNIGAAAALSLSLLYLAMFLLTGLIGGITYLFWR